MSKLLPADALLSTGPVDHADWNYRPLLGWIIRLRYRLVVSLLPPGRVPMLLEVGYGSGVFMPELRRHCDELHGVDIHERSAEVEARLAEHRVNAFLHTASVESLPYEDGTLDCVVAVSSLEFVSEIERAARELKRVLRPNGCLVLVTPGSSALVDAGLELLTGESAANDYGGRRERLLPALLECFTIDRRKTFPPLASRLVCVYTAMRMRPRS